MRAMFIMLRLAGYGGIGIGLWMQGEFHAWLTDAISISIMAWCIGDHWKKPSDSSSALYIGALLETVLILSWTFLLQSDIPLFALLSPLARTGIHLSWKQGAVLLALQLTGFLMAHYSFHAEFYLQLILLLVAGSYAFVLGALLKGREQARRLLALSAFEQELRVRDEERLRIAGQLHDRTGQYWASIVRALDVALRVEGDDRIRFMNKAREASLEGLHEMRRAVAEWSEGRQQPSDWMQFMEQSIKRMQQTLDLAINCRLSAIDWGLMDAPSERAELIARTVIESMTNAVRHGGANRIDVVMEQIENTLYISVKDNGIGFDTVIAEAAGVGLKTMNKLIPRAGGQLYITSKHGQGTTVQLTFALASGC